MSANQTFIVQWHTIGRVEVKMMGYLSVRIALRNHCFLDNYPIRFFVLIGLNQSKAMKNILTLFALALICAQCTTLEFEHPLPNDGQEVKILPRNLVGLYESLNDSGELVRSYQRIVFIPKDASWELYTQSYLLAASLDTTHEALVRNDSLFAIESDTSSPKFAFKVKRDGDRYITDPRLHYHLEPAKGKFVIYDEDTGDPSDHTLVLRKSGEVYYFNIREADANYWQTTTLQLTPKGIRFQYLSSPQGHFSDLPFITRPVVGTSADGNPDTTRVANPTDLELEKYRNDQRLINGEELIRLDPKK
jgi:hypothetical protein